MVPSRRHARTESNPSIAYIRSLTLALFSMRGIGSLTCVKVSSLNNSLILHINCQLYVWIDIAGTNDYLLEYAVNEVDFCELSLYIMIFLWLPFSLRTDPFIKLCSSTTKYWFSLVCNYPGRNIFNADCGRLFDKLFSTSYWNNFNFIGFSDALLDGSWSEYKSPFF